MPIETVARYWHTLRYLRPVQIYGRLWRWLYHPRIAAASIAASGSRSFTLVEPIPRYCSLAGTSFTFLNRSHDFPEQIDWEFASFGRLWTYNLNYFDFLNQPGLGRAQGLQLIRGYLADLPQRATGLEPYPTSLRIINWAKFVVRHQVRDEQIEQALYRQAVHLMHNLEYHLLGNHLLENGFALLYAAALFPEGPFCRKAEEIIRTELEEQVLADGGHFERSPMYHQIILDRLLDAINILQSTRVLPDLLPLLRDKAILMLGWLRQMTFANGEIPLVNDAAFGIAPPTAELCGYADRLGVPATVRLLGASGYRKVAKSAYEMVLDVGSIGPDYIPGHAHSDTFNFVLYAQNRPVIVDTGTSAYDTGARRLVERGTAAHNTVQVDGVEQSEVWGSFRVARRAYVRDLEEGNDMIRAWHDGYCRIGVRHNREFDFAEEAIVIRDAITANKEHEATARIHFHPDVEVRLEGDDVVAGPLRLRFVPGNLVTLKEYRYAPEFNKLVPARMIEIGFSGSLVTRITIELNEN